MAKQSAPTGVQSIDRASALLIHILEANKPPLLGQLASAHELPKSTTSRLLGALERQGLIKRDRLGAYFPGHVINRFARQRNQELDLVTRMRPILETLAQKTGETSNLAIAGSGFVELIDQVDGRYLLGATNWIGASVPYHCSALGKVLLAYSAVKIPAGRLERRTPKSITSRTRLLEELEMVRRQGFATIVDELEEGLVAIAAPVRELDGTILGAISISAPTARLSSNQFKALGELMIAEINRVLTEEDKKAGAA
jgi:DNA-binding IclR family transcriptional regulator